jgi:hypothetical protein
LDGLPFRISELARKNQLQSSLAVPSSQGNKEQTIVASAEKSTRGQLTVRIEWLKDVARSEKRCCSD